MKAGADTDVPDAVSGRTALHFAALRSDLAAVKALVLAGAETEVRDSADGRTPLHLACIVARPPSEQQRVPLYLLEVAGAAGSAADAYGMTALDVAVRRGCAEVVLAVFRETGGAPAPGPENAGLLYEAVRGGDARIVGALVAAGWEAGVPGAEGGEGRPSQPEAAAATVPAGEEAAVAPPGSVGGPAEAVVGSPAAVAAAAESSTVAAMAPAGEKLSPLMLAADRSENGGRFWI